MNHRDRCLFWARIFEMPRSVLVLRGNQYTKHRVPAGDASILAARALRYYAEKDT
jgi:hypothetical protein